MGSLITEDEFSSKIASIYTGYIPAVKNLYTITLDERDSKYRIKGNASSASLTSANLVNSRNNNLIQMAELHAVSVTLPSEVFTLERNPVTKNYTLKSAGSFERVENLTIKWRENSNWDIRRYHDAWLGLFYDKKKDCYLSAENESEANSRYRTFTITLPEDARGQVHKIKCYDVIPKSAWDLSLQWGNTPSAVEYTINYYLSGWEWVVNSGAGSLDYSTSSLS